MEFIIIIAVALAISYPATIMLKKTFLKERFSTVQIYFLCLSLYMSLEAAVRFIHIIN